MKVNSIIVGSYGGIGKRWKYSDFSELLLFDPSDDNKQHPKHVKFINKPVYDGTVKDFYVLNKSECSSLFRPNYEYIKSYFGFVDEKYQIKEVVKIETINIADYLQKDKNYDFLQIDTQGSEYQILTSLGAILNSFKIILVEAFNFEFYENIKLFPEINEFLLSHGFTMCGKIRPDEKLFNDYFYIKEECEITKFVLSKFNAILI